MKMNPTSLPTSSNQSQYLAELNNTGTEYPRNSPIHEVFEYWAQTTPDSLALVQGERGWTYRELNQRSNQIAHFLREAGAGKESLIGLCLERSCEMIAGILGVLKAGSAYVPLDPIFPSERLNFMADDCGIKQILCLKSLSVTFPPAIKLCFLDEEKPAFHDFSKDDPKHQVGGDDLAYVMYTSGSTGRPKGVSIPHRGVVRLVKNTNYVDLDPKTVVLQFAPYTFDASTFEIWAPLLNGGRLEIFRPGLPTFSELGTFIQERKINTLWLNTSFFHEWVDTEPMSLSCLRQLLVGGEAVSPGHVRKFLSQSPGCRVINGYGPTESTTFACCYPVSSPEQLVTTTPIGKPISNTRVYVLDSQMKMAPFGETGELYIGGDGLARGYLNLPELTLEKFLPDPFSREQGARLYRTGDLVRWLPDGNLDFVGRIDEQVKIRGFRIEPGEIESMLLQHPLVSSAAVVVKTSSIGEKCLVAYWVSKKEKPVSNQADDSNHELYLYLKNRLLEQMVPAAIHRLEAMPVNSNGKIDRQALRQLPDTQDLTRVGYVPPGTPLESMLVEIWEDLLKVKKIGIHDNFFALGGHSLLALQFFTRLQKLLNKELPLATLFKEQTIAGLAKAIVTETADPFDLIQVIQDGDKKTALAWFGHSSPLYEIKKGLSPEHQLIIVEMEGMQGFLPQYKTIQEMAGYYASRLADIIDLRDVVLAGFSMGGLVAFETAIQLDRNYGLKTSLLLIDPSPPGKTPNLSKTITGSLRYYWSGFAWWLSIFYSNLTFKFSRLKQCHQLLKEGKQIPLKWRFWYFESFYRRAISQYKPDIYDGELNLICLPKNVPGQDHWIFNYSRTHHFYTVAASSHQELVENPECVKKWLPQLKRIMDKEKQL